jgi:hypothetical protein
MAASSFPNFFILALLLSFNTTHSFFGANIKGYSKSLKYLKSSKTRCGQSTLRQFAVRDEFCGGISGNGFVSAKAIVTTSLIRNLTSRVLTSPLASAALGRSITCALLMADGLSENDSIQLHFKGDGCLGQIIAVANGRMEAKGYVAYPQSDLPPKSEGKIDVGGV